MSATPNADAPRLNVLISAAGRRNYLVTWFREALVANGLSGTVIVADADRNAPARAAADVACDLPSIDDPAYESALLTLCRERSVNLALSLNDHELSHWATLDRSQFEALSVTLLSLPAAGQEMVEDKLLMASRLSDAGLRVPPTSTAASVVSHGVDPAVLGERVILKNRFGSGSRGLVMSSPSKLMDDIARSAPHAVNRLGRPVSGPAEGTECLVVQRYVDGTEHGLDCVNDLTGRFAAVLARRKLRMRAGETDQAQSESAERFTDLGKGLSAALGHRGLVDCDAIEDASGDQWLIDVNPRFGGGYPFSHLAGANIPAAYVAWMCGREPDASWLTCRPGVLSAKHIAITTVRVDG